MADRITEYRIRWANVMAYGYGGGEHRMCIAERRVRFLWFRFWWPVNDWQWNEAAAQRDVEYDRLLRTPLPDPTAA